MRRILILTSLLLAPANLRETQPPLDDPIFWPRLTPPPEIPPTPPSPAVPPPPAYMATFSGDFDVVGTEPFWTLEVRRTGMKLTRPGKSDVTATTYTETFWPSYAVWTESPINLTLSLESCSDGMSDRAYAYKAVAIVDGSTLTGCADRPKRP